MRLTVADAISPSYFVAIAAIQLGFFQQEGVDMEFVFSPPNPSQALKDGTIDFFGGFRPGHNLQSLEDVADVIARL